MKRLTPLRAIRAKCMDCSNNQIFEVRDCVITKCPLWDYRMGHNPNRKGIGGKGDPELGKKKKDNEFGEIIDKDILE